MKHIYPLKPCPWCKETPKFFMGILQTWMPCIKCQNDACTVQPKSKYVPIRKKQKENPVILKEKIERVISRWNEDNPMVATEGFAIDFDILAADANSTRLGLTDHCLNN